MRTTALLPLFIALNFAAPVHAAPADKLYSTLSPSIWRVVVADASGKSFAQGSAVVVAPETLLTNCHVLAKASSIAVRQDTVAVPAKLQLIDVERDMCQIVARGLNAPAVRIGDSDRLSVGQRIYALGNPLGLELTLSDGLVSALRRDSAQKLKYIQISAPISHGSSGGGLFNEDGALVGITSAGMENGQNLNIAIPINWYQDLPQRSAAALAGYSGSGRAIGAGAPPAPALPWSPPVAANKPAGEAAAGVVVRQPPPVAPRPTRTLPTAARGPYARIDDIDKLVALSPNNRAGYLEFLDRPLPRAFALAGSKGYWSAWTRKPRNPDDDPDPAVRVLSGCEKYHHRPCVLYAVDNVVVYRPGDLEAASARQP
jgi:serine protease Do